MARGRARRDPTIIAMHHPPIPTGIAEFDRSACPRPTSPRSASPGRRDDVLRVASGHIHRVITRPWAAFGHGRAERWRQAVLDLGPEGRAVGRRRRAPGYALHLLTDGGVLV